MRSCSVLCGVFLLLLLSQALSGAHRDGSVIIRGERSPGIMFKLLKFIGCHFHLITVVLYYRLHIFQSYFCLFYKATFQQVRVS